MQTRIDRTLLQAVEIFSGLEDSALDEVLRVSRRRRLRQGETVFEQHQEANTFYVAVEGRLKVSQVTPEGHQVVVRFIGPREMLGCVAVCGGGHYPGTATAVSDSLLIGWTKGVIQYLMERYPKIATNALATVGGRLQETQQRVRELSTEKVERRVAHALTRLAAQAGRRVDGGVQIDFQISRQDIAEMTGTTLHTVSRTLSAWEDQGIVESGRQKVVIRKPHALVAIAEDLPAPAG